MWSLFEAQFFGVGDYLHAVRRASPQHPSDWSELTRVDYPHKRVETRGWLVMREEEEKEGETVDRALERIKKAMMEDPSMKFFCVVPMSSTDLI